MSQPQVPDAGQITVLLHQIQQGEDAAVERLYPLVYQELRAAARRALAREKPGHTLQATELVHEAFLKMMGPSPVSWQDRAHFVGVAARAMRQVLVDHARRRLAEKRGAGAHHVTLGDADAAFALPSNDVLALNEALERLEQLDSRLRAVVEYRFFGGLREKEIAELLDVTERTVQRDWVKARAWLHKEIYQKDD